MMQPASVLAGLSRAVAGGHPAQLAEMQRLRERVAELEDLLGVRTADFFPLRLRPQARIIFWLLLARSTVTAETLIGALYAGRPDCDRPNDPASVIKQQLKHLRAALAPHHPAGAVMIETHRDDLAPTYYRMPPDIKAWAAALIERRPGRPLS